MVKQITDNNFETDVLQSPLPVLIDFWAAWCGPCRMIAPIVEELSKDYEGRVIVGKLNIDENPETPGKLGVRGVPTLMLYKDGSVVSSKVGASSKGEIIKWLDSCLS